MMPVMTGPAVLEAMMIPSSARRPRGAHERQSSEVLEAPAGHRLPAQALGLAQLLELVHAQRVLPASMTGYNGTPRFFKESSMLSN